MTDKQASLELVKIARSLVAKDLATPAKLRDGSWGARVVGKARRGQRIFIQAKGGRKWEATVDKVFWTGEDRYTGEIISLVSTESDKRSNEVPSSSRDRVCDECGKHSTRLVPCRDSSGIEGQCCPSCARGSAYERSFM